MRALRRSVNLASIFTLFPLFGACGEDSGTTAAVAAAVALAGAAAAASTGGEPEPPKPQPPPPIGNKTLPISPIAQQTAVWCWAAAAEMVFRFYAMPRVNPNYQCGIVAAYFGNQCQIDCFSCIAPIGSVSQLQVLINQYGAYAANFTFSSRNLSSSLLFRALTFDETAQEISNGRPILAGISPTGYSYPNISQHVILIVGYENLGTTKNVIVNDPFPYAAFPTANPYLSLGGRATLPGQYSISYASLVGPISWGNTIHRIQ